MLVDFSVMRAKAKEGIQELTAHAGSVAWEDFGDAGNPCYDPCRFDTEKEREMDALTLAAVKVELQKGSKLHHKLAGLVAAALGNKYVSYDWLIKAVTRILNGTTIHGLHEMLVLSENIRAN